MQTCGICNGVKPPGSHHCRQCKRCVVGMDHHCPWINNCVGKRNKKAFLLFLFYVFGLCLFHLANFMWAAVFCAFKQTECRWNFNFYNPQELAIIFASISLAMIFVTFTFVMLAFQLNLIRTNTSTIDRKNKLPAAHTSLCRKIPQSPS